MNDDTKKYEINTIMQSFHESVGLVRDLQSLQQVKADFLGKKGKLTTLMEQIKDVVNTEQRKAYGTMLYSTKTSMIQCLESKRQAIEKKLLNEALLSDVIDITLDGHSTYPYFGKKHILSSTILHIKSIMAALGFQEVDGPEIESEWYNFSSLNIPQNHPARQMHDTFYVAPPAANQVVSDDGRMLLRTHTSNVQIRHMEKHRPPIKIFSCGRVYRSDYDTTHTPMFHQLEVLWVDTHITLAYMVSTIKNFLRLFFELDNLPMRLRPSYFPFTEPSFEIDIGYQSHNSTANNSYEWLEVVGAGMVHHKVLMNVGISPQQYQGFAFGFGIDRLTMLKHDIRDIRSLFENDKRWLNYYGIIGHNHQ